ncbi:phage-like element PBSX protein xkdT [Lachnospiraceae bacterium KM106-2]|nr:phage-like element PBSX protein xkdT [Lachnospiraceae bacterium KM106-2]
MYEEYTFESIMERMLESAKNVTDIDTSEGSLVYTALAPCAWELSEIYGELEEIYENTFAETAPREQLILRAQERGIKPREATKAIFQVELDPNTVELEIGETFTLDEYTFSFLGKEIDENTSEEICKVQCETAGKTPAQILNQFLYPTDYIEGLDSIKLIQLLVPGVDEEDTEVFRQRYWESFNNQGFGGNKADYIQYVKDKFPSVGAVKVYRRTKNDENVIIQILNSEYGVASTTLVNEVQKVICPKAGEGDGLAPIGHNVLVENTVEKQIKIALHITLENNRLIDSEVQKSINEVVDDYFLSLAQKWESESTLTVVSTKIASDLIEKIEGVQDIRGVQLNEFTDMNIILESNQIPVRDGDVNVITENTGVL